MKNVKASESLVPGSWTPIKYHSSLEHLLSSRTASLNANLSLQEKLDAFEHKLTEERLGTKASFESELSSRLITMEDELNEEIGLKWCPSARVRLLSRKNTKIQPRRCGHL